MTRNKTASAMTVVGRVARERRLRIGGAQLRERQLLRGVFGAIHVGRDWNHSTRTRLELFYFFE